MKNIGIIGMASMVNIEIAAQILKKDDNVILVEQKNPFGNEPIPYVNRRISNYEPYNKPSNKPHKHVYRPIIIDIKLY